MIHQNHNFSIHNTIHMNVDMEMNAYIHRHIHVNLIMNHTNIFEIENINLSIQITIGSFTHFISRLNMNMNGMFRVIVLIIMMFRLPNMF